MSAPATHPPQPPGKFVRDVILSLGGNLGSLLLGVVAGAVTARLLGPEGRGVFGLVLALAQLVFIAVGFGLPVSMTWHVSSGRYRLADLLSLNRHLLLLTGTLGLLVFYGLAFGFRERLVGSATTATVALSGWLVVETLFIKQWAGFLRGMRRISEAAGLGMARQAARILLTLALVGWLGLDVFGAVLATVASSMLTTWGFARRVRRFDPATVASGEEPVRAAGVLRFGLVEWVLGLLWFSNTRIDAFLILGMRGEADVGYYTQAAGLAEQVWLVSSAVSGVLLPSIVAQGADERGRLTAQTCRMTALLLVAIGVPLLLLARPIVLLLFGSEFLPSVAPFRVLLGATTALAVRALLADYFRAQGMLRLNVGTTALASVVNVLGNLWAIPRYGILGSACASLASYGLDLVLCLIAFRATSGIPVHRLLVPRAEDFRRLAGLGARLLRRASGPAAGGG